MANILSPSQIINEEYQEICANTRCVLDDQREGQSGLTARFMWALAAGKKIITTNTCAYKYAFVNRDQVEIIDKNNPVIPVDFLQKIDFMKSDVKEFYIDKWVSTLLS